MKKIKIHYQFATAKGKIRKKHKDFYWDSHTSEHQQRCEGGDTILDDCNPLETVLRGQGNNDALDALNTIENEENDLAWIGIPSC